MLPPCGYKTCQLIAKSFVTLLLFQSNVLQHAKVLKKKARKERPFRDSKEIERLGSVILYQDLLNGMGGEVARNDFLKGTNGAIVSIMIAKVSINVDNPLGPVVQLAFLL